MRITQRNQVLHPSIPHAFFPRNSRAIRAKPLTVYYSAVILYLIGMESRDGKQEQERVEA